MALNRLLGNETRINLSFVACIDDVELDAKPRLPLLSSAGPTRCLSRPTRSSLAGANNRNRAATPPSTMRPPTVWQPARSRAATTTNLARRLAERFEREVLTGQAALDPSL